jgi:hypothetical protein
MTTTPVSVSVTPIDQAAIILERTRGLLWKCRNLAPQLAAKPDGWESPAGAAQRIAWGALVAVLEQGLAETLDGVTDVLRAVSALGPLG